MNKSYCTYWDQRRTSIINFSVQNGGRLHTQPERVPLAVNCWHAGDLWPNWYWFRFVTDPDSITATAWAPGTHLGHLWVGSHLVLRGANIAFRYGLILSWYYPAIAVFKEDYCFQSFPKHPTYFGFTNRRNIQRSFVWLYHLIWFPLKCHFMDQDYPK